MIRKYLTLLFFLFPFSMYAQVSCKDSTLADPYHVCIDPYQPVCGCDGKTYRNQCAATFWGGLVGTTPSTPGVCDNFDFDFVPNPVSAFSTSNSTGNFLNVFVNPNQLPTSVQVYLFDVFNRLQFSRYLYVTSNDTYIIGGGTPVNDLNTDFFAALNKGVYLLVITCNGEQKSKKIMKVNIE